MHNAFIDNQRTKRHIQIAQLVGGLLLLLASGHVRYYIGSIPHTMQTQAILCLALCYPRKTALLTVLLYTITATIAPTALSMSSGLFGASAGYFIGFLCAVNLLTQKTGRTTDIWVSILWAQLIIWACGMLYLSGFVGLECAFWTGVYPFVITDSLKSLSAVFLLRRFQIELQHKQ